MLLSPLVFPTVPPCNFDFPGLRVWCCGIPPRTYRDDGFPFSAASLCGRGPSRGFSGNSLYRRCRSAELRCRILQVG
jgi:hypothetical protein